MRAALFHVSYHSCPFLARLLSYLAFPLTILCPLSLPSLFSPLSRSLSLSRPFSHTQHLSLSYVLSLLRSSSPSFSLSIVCPLSFNLSSSTSLPLSLAPCPSPPGMNERERRSETGRGERTSEMHGYHNEKLRERETASEEQRRVTETDNE